MNRRFWLLVFLPLAMGLLIYLFIRENTLLSSLIPGDYKWKKVPAYLNFIAGWLPDFLWCFSLSSCLLSFYWIRTYKYAFFFITSALILSELIQLFIKGFIFDFFDLGAAILASGISFRLKEYN